MTAFSLSEAQALFKINYYKRSENLYNSANVLLGRVKKKYDFTGRSRFVATSHSFQGGVGSGSLPTTNVASYQEATFSAKKVYARCDIDREAIKAAADDAGAFIKQTKHSVEKTVESWNRNMSRILFGVGDGSLGVGDGATNVTGAGTSGNPYVVVLQASTFIEANWEEQDYINYDAETSNLEIAEVVPSTYTIKLVGTSVGLAALTGVGPVPTNKYFYMQGSKDNDPYGLKQVLSATSGSLYGVSVTRRWQATQENAGGAGITVDLMNKVMLNVEKKTGKVPNLIVASYVQLRKILNLLEDAKEYMVEPRSADLKGKLSFRGVEFMSTMGAVPMFADRFMPDSEVWFLNDNHIEIHHRPGFGWFDDDGTVFLRKADSDEYEARYGGYLQVYIEPTFHGRLHNLST